MSTSRAEGSRLAPLSAINQFFILWILSISWFSRIFKDPTLSKIRKILEIDEITIVNNIFVENRKFNENDQEMSRRKAAVDCFDCCERMLRMPGSVPTEACLADFTRLISASPISTEAYFNRSLVRTPQSRRVYARSFCSENCGNVFNFFQFSREN